MSVLNETRNYSSCASRVRFMGGAMIVVMMLGWLASVWPLDDSLDAQGTPIGADFSMFYVSGKVVADGHHAQLYNQALHQQQLHEVFPNLKADFCLPYRYPPVVAGLLSPLSRLSYPQAYVVWTLLAVASMLLSAVLMKPEWSRLSSSWRQASAIAFCGWPVVWETIIGGQASWLALLIVAASYRLLIANRIVCVGVVLGFAAYKPNVLALFALGLAIRYPKMLLGITLSGAAMLVGSWAVTGADGIASYLTMLTGMTSGPWVVETPYWKVHGLATWTDALIPGYGKALTLIFGCGFVAAIGTWWRREASSTNSNPIAVSLLLIANGLFNPYTPIYDLLLWGPAVLLLMSSTGGFKSTSNELQQTLLWRPSPALVNCGAMLLLLGPHLSQTTAKFLGWQVFPLAVVALIAAARTGRTVSS